MADPSADQMQDPPVVQWWGYGVGGCTLLLLYVTVKLFMIPVLILDIKWTFGLKPVILQLFIKQNINKNIHKTKCRMFTCATSRMTLAYNKNMFTWDFQSVFLQFWHQIFAERHALAKKKNQKRYFLLCRYFLLNLFFCGNHDLVTFFFFFFYK